MVVELERTPTPLLSSSLSAVAYFFQECSIHLSDLPFNVFVISSSLPPILALDIYYFLSRVPLFSLIGHTIITPVPFLSIHHLSPLHFSPLLLCKTISTSLQSLPSFPAHSYAIFCYAWRIHLACGRLGSDGYISWEGGGGVW